MQEQTADFKLDVSDESIKRNAMKVVWVFSGVTFVDIKEKGRVKVRGNFDKYAMGKALQKIDKSVDIINPPMQKPEQNHIPFTSSISSYFNVPKEIVVFEFKILNEQIKPEAMEVIWEYSVITSVEVEENRRLKVKGGEFNKLEMLTKLQEIDDSVTILSFGQDVEVKHAVNNGSSNPTKNFMFNIFGNKQSGASSSKGPTPAQMYGAAGARARARADAEKAKAQTPVNNGLLNQAIGILKVPIEAGFRALDNPKPQINHVGLLIAKQKEDNLRIQKENAEKKEKAEKLRIEKVKAEKLRIEKVKAEKKLEEAEKLRIKKEKEAKKLRINEKEKENTEGKKTQSWFRGSSSMGSTYLPTLWNTSQPTQSSNTLNPSQPTQSSFTLNPFQSTQSTRTTGSTQCQSSTKKTRNESQ